MLFSVIIPSFNRRQFLPAALASVRAQANADYEVIVVDDGSTDGTAEYLSGLTPSIEVIRQDNLGPGAARNAGMARAQGEYIAFLDSDDVWFPWTLDVFGQLIHEHDRPAMLSARVMQFSDDGALAGVTAEEVTARHFDDFIASAATPILIGSGTVVVRRDVAIAGGGFTIRRITGEDQDWILRIGTASGFVSVLAPVTLGWRRHHGGETQSLERSVEGAQYLIAQETAGKYPGGRERARQRRDVITRTVRPVSFACLRANAVRLGLDLYRQTASWHRDLGRWTYLTAFPMAAMWAAARASAGRRPS